MKHVRKVATVLAALTLLVALPLPAVHAESIWIEGEAAQTKQVTPHGWYNSVKRDSLSGKDWLSHFDNSREGSAGFRFQAATAGEHTFWLRANPVQASINYRFNGGAWQKVDVRGDQRDTMNIAEDNKPDLRFVAWIRVGKVALLKGANTLDVRFNSGPSNHGAIDCLCLTDEPWAPSGISKPGDNAVPAGPDTWFPVIFDDDPLSPDSVTDMSAFIEAPAGQHGFLKRDGANLRFAGMTGPVKFWGVGSGPESYSPEEMRQAARWLRKHGVNLVRQHTMVDAVGLLDRAGNFNGARLDHYDRWFAALKEQGIYSTWSVIYPHHGPFLQKSDGYDPARFAELDRGDREHDGSRGPIVVNDFINLDRQLQDIALRYFDKLLNHTNPYTGLAYKNDPALAVLEFQNESNVYFHTLNALRDGKEYPLFTRMMRQGFFEFVKEKYGSKEATARAWQNRWDRDDQWEQGELGLMGAYHWGSDGPLYEFQGQTRRAGDYLEFLTRLQRDYYARRESEVRRLGFQAVTVTTAWKAGGPSASMPNLFADTAADMIDRHNYFGGGDGGHVITEGKVDTETHLSQPGHGLLNLALFQAADRPFSVSEWSMMPPSPWTAEAAPLYAFYGMGLQGWDAVYHFNCGAQRMGNGWPNLSKYVTHTPHYLGQFPALAFAVYHGHLREGEVVAGRQLSRDEVFSGTDVLGQALSGGGFDNKQLSGRLTTPAEAVAIGRVTIGFEGGKETPIKADLDRYWDKRKKTLTSTTGELVWNYGDRCVEVRSPKTQGFIGFTGGRALALPAVTGRVKTGFVSLLFTPLDNADLADSRHILITALARDKQTGAEYSTDWSRLLKIGAPPLLLEPVQASLKFAGARPAAITPLDVYGVPVPAKAIQPNADGSFVIDGMSQAYYYEVKR